MNKAPGPPLAGAPLPSLLVATDLSEGARRAVDRAALLPLAPDAAIELLHVVPRRAGPGRRPGRLAEVRRAVAEEARRLRSFLGSRGLAGVETRTTIRSGAPFAEILRRAGELGPDLVVVGGHGRGVLKTLLIGSTAERVVRGRSAPVLVAKRPARRPYARPLLALDPTSRLVPVVSFALRILDRGVESLDLVSATRSRSRDTSGAGAPRPVPCDGCGGGRRASPGGGSRHSSRAGSRPGSRS